MNPNDAVIISDVRTAVARGRKDGALANSRTTNWQYTFGRDDGFSPIELSGKTLWEKKLLSGGRAKVSLTKATIDIKPRIDTELVSVKATPKSGHAILSTSVLGEFEIEAITDGSFDFEKSGSLFSKKFGSTVKGTPLSLAIDVFRDATKIARSSFASRRSDAI